MQVQWASFAFDDDFNLVPVLRLVFLEVFVRAGEGVVAALELAAADEDAAVGVGGGAEIELEREVVGEVARGVDLLDAAACGGRRGDEAAVDGAERPSAEADLPSKVTGFRRSDRRAFFVACPPLLRCSPVLRRRFCGSPSRLGRGR